MKKLILIFLSTIFIFQSCENKKANTNQQKNQIQNDIIKPTSIINNKE